MKNEPISTKDSDLKCKLRRASNEERRGGLYLILIGLALFALGYYLITHQLKGVNLGVITLLLPIGFMGLGVLLGVGGMRLLALGINDKERQKIIAEHERGLEKMRTEAREGESNVRPKNHSN
jgi:hypothetical protein